MPKANAAEEAAVRAARGGEQPLDSDGVAALLGVTRGSVFRMRSMYRAGGRFPRTPFPEPDIKLGASPGWYPSTIRAWDASRLGQGRPGEPKPRKRRGATVDSP